MLVGNIIQKKLAKTPKRTGENAKCNKLILQIMPTNNDKVRPSLKQKQYESLDEQWSRELVINDNP